MKLVFVFRNYKLIEFAQFLKYFENFQNEKFSKYWETQ